MLKPCAPHKPAVTLPESSRARAEKLMLEVQDALTGGGFSLVGVLMPGDGELRIVVADELPPELRGLGVGC